MNKEVIFQVRVLDHDASEQHIRKGIAGATGEPKDCVCVKTLRPAFGFTQNARVTLPVALGKKLSMLPKVRIGWVSCKITQLDDETRCYRY